MLVQSVTKAIPRWLTRALEGRARQQSIRCSGVACIPPGVLQLQVSKPLRPQNSDVNVSSTDIDDTSLEFARKNVLANALQDRISVVQADANGPVLFPLHRYKFLYLGNLLHVLMYRRDTKYDFTLCNPPFYSSRDEIAQSAAAKEFGPNAVRKYESLVYRRLMR